MLQAPTSQSEFTPQALPDRLQSPDWQSASTWHTALDEVHAPAAQSLLFLQACEVAMLQLRDKKAVNLGPE